MNTQPFTIKARPANLAHPLHHSDAFIMLGWWRQIVAFKSINVKPLYGSVSLMIMLGRKKYQWIFLERCIWTTWCVTAKWVFRQSFCYLINCFAFLSIIWKFSGGEKQKLVVLCYYLFKYIKDKVKSCVRIFNTQCHWT